MTVTRAKSELGVLLQTLVWLSLAVTFYTLVRLEFLIWNWKNWFQTIQTDRIAEAMLQGIRFDISSLTWLSSLVLIGALLPWPFIALTLKEMTLKTVFLLVHIPFLLFNLVDVEFIHFAGRRMTPDSFYLMRESTGKFMALFETYWLLFCANTFLCLLFFTMIKRLKITVDPQHSVAKAFRTWKLRLPLSFGFLILFIIMARGGFQPKPLEMAHAAALVPDVRLTQLTLNSSFTTIHSLQKKRLSRLNYTLNNEEPETFLNATTPGRSIQPWSKRPKNVVLFILESFGLEYTGLDGGQEKSFTPFLDSLQNKSIYFANSFANGRRSIESLPSLLAGIPSLVDEPFLTGPFLVNDIPRLGVDLNDRGIWTGFFHGGANGTMFFQEFSQRIGITNYFGKDEYPNSDDDDGTWGIWDGPYLNFFGDHLTKINSSPFFAVFFSLSSHHPFRVPESYATQLPQGPLPILQSIAYTDLMLSEFFQKYATAPWFKETLFIITADHTSKSYLPNYQTPLGNFRVPLLLYFPGAEFSKDKELLDPTEPVQHIDVFPTVREIFSVDQSSSKLSRSLLRTGPRKVTLYLDGEGILVEKNKTLILPTEINPPDSLDPSLQSWKAQRQYFINGLIDNKL
jgi:phosphoglycerol transferase MdoB-like AlkP superfamily enzyme